MPLPARALLTATDTPKPAWAVFDSAWYFQTYPQARAQCGDAQAAALDHYLNLGAALGHAPSPLFDEIFYLESNPDIRVLIENGRYQSGFDHFCQSGHRLLSPHWLFDDHLYERLYEDMSLENLDLHGCAGRYDHYLKSGQFEGRQAHFLFDAQFYRAQAIAENISEQDIDLTGPFAHYLYRLTSRARELAPSIYFDPAWYRRATFGIKSLLESRAFGSAVEHYLRNDTPAIFNPVPEFSEAFYGEVNRDVGHAVESGNFRCGYQHFVQFGAFELRQPHPDIDLVYYRDKNPRVSHDLNTGAIRDAFAHLRLIGIPEKLDFAHPDGFVQISEPAAKRLFLDKAENNLLTLARQKLDFRSSDPKISVIMVAFNRFALTMLSLSSLRGNDAGDVQLILVDNGSCDNTRVIERYIDGAIILRLTENAGFPTAANLALAHSSAPVTLYLNNDVELGLGALGAALKRLASSSGIGAVGGKIVRSHGKLQEAGSIIWNDGTADGYLRDASPAIAEANFVRQVDYCSGVFLAGRTDVLKSFGGFDEDFSPAYYEDADLCVRLIKAGYKIIYDPAIVVHHLEFGSSEKSGSSMALMKRAHRIFHRKHSDFIDGKFLKHPSNITNARSTSAAKKILFIEDTIPLRQLGSGFVRANDVIRAIVQAGYDVSIFPVNGTLEEPATLLADFPDHVEILYGQDFNSLPQFLSDRRGFYDLVWVSRTHNLNRALSAFAAAGMTPQSMPFILDTEAVVSLRDAMRHLLQPEGRTFDFEQSLAHEFSLASGCAAVLAVSNMEVAMLRDLRLPNVTLVGTMREPAPTPNHFSERGGLLFVASIHQHDSPNLDSLYWYRDEILPCLAEEMADPPILNFVGYTAPSIDLSEFADDPRIKIHGPTDNLGQFYAANRVFIAPTRFAAGTPYKIYEAASFGLPCVTTDLLARQLGWDAGLELLIAPVSDPRRFASQIAILYRTETLWNKLRRQALKRLADENSPEKFNQAVQNVLGQAFDRNTAEHMSPAIGKRRPARKPVPVR